MTPFEGMQAYALRFGFFAQLDTSGLTNIIAALIYLALFAIALWGAFCVIIVWMRVAQKRFTGEAEQDEFLIKVEQHMANRDFASAESVAEGDLRATPQLVNLALKNRHLDFKQVRHVVADRFQRDVLADLEHRLSWVHTVIKAAPMVGLLGTVMGMMGAFAKLAAAENINPTMLADDISVALRTTAAGLTIAIPLVMATNSINVRIRKMEDLVGAGLTRFFDVFQQTIPPTK